MLEDFVVEGERRFASYPILGVHFIGFCLNLLLIVISLRRCQNKQRRKKWRLLAANLGLCNAAMETGFLVYIGLIRLNPLADLNENLLLKNWFEVGEASCLH